MDLNGLITTIISSTAGLVAIIGGFLVSRVISLSSEQTGIKRRVRELDNDMMAKKELLQNVEDYLLEDDAKEFLKDNIKKILQKESLSIIVHEDKNNYRPEEELKPYFDEIVYIIEELDFLFDHLDELEEDFDDFYLKNKHHLKDTEKRDLYEIAYEGMIEWYKSLGQSVKFGLAGMSFKLATPPTINTVYKDKIKERDRLIDDIRVLDLQKNEQKKILSDYGKPRWVWGGLAVLIYACIVGIVYPGTLLPYPRDTYNDTLTKWFLLGLFYSHLAALFIYLGYAMYKLTYEKKE